jgi:hypothetical protein
MRRLSDKPFTSEQALTVLAQTPQRIVELTDGLTRAQLRASPGLGEWSANDVLAHLRSCADVWNGCIRRLLDEDHPTLRAINPTTYIKQTDYPDLEFAPSLRAFTAQRAEILKLLEPLPTEAWARSATVTGAGSPLQRTVLDYAWRMARHERTHCRQLAKISAAARV